MIDKKGWSFNKLPGGSVVAIPPAPSQKRPGGRSEETHPNI